ncbi:hypothetical protein Pint_31874 [Pistacia integerrima]|uniref:Uncharacterized protein n=1 Tax=Pistacia integerrima TaxID=434235 RepID=A0ACC0XPI9_9ROSI|nr:hypothetical protein Pint_31874 [Pistacia integerrima]
MLPCPSRAASVSFSHHSDLPLLSSPTILLNLPPLFRNLPSFNTNRMLDTQNIAAACDSLHQHIFENSLPEKPSLLNSFSPWNQIKPDKSSFIEMFGELHFKETSSPSSSSSTTTTSSSSAPSFPMSSSSSFLDIYPQPHHNNSGYLDDGNKKSPSSLDLFSNTPNIKYTSCHTKSDSFSSMNSESLQLCTEGLGFESSDDVEDLKSEISEDWQTQQERVSIAKHSPTENLCTEFRRSKTCGGAFPPPISCIGKSGKPWVCFKSYRHDGRFVLKEIRMPSQEFLHACREDGRLKLQFVQPNDDILELEEEDFEEDEGFEDVEVDVEEEEDNESFDDVEEEKRTTDNRRNEVGKDSL